MLYKVVQLEYNGNTRTGTWDVGAFEYGAGGLSPAIWERIKPFIEYKEDVYELLRRAIR